MKELWTKMTDFRYDMDIGHLQMNMIEVFMQKVLPVGSKGIRNSSSLELLEKSVKIKWNVILSVRN